MTENFSENGIIIPENFIECDDAFDEIEDIIDEKNQEKVIFQKESDFHNISVCDTNFGRYLMYGMSIQAGKIVSENYTGNVPYLNYFLLDYLLKKDAKKVLLLGFGIGLFVKQFESLFDKLEKFDAVDIEENIMDIAEKYFDFKKSKNFEFHLQDALVFLRKNKTKYDIIIADIAGNEGVDERFYNDEFFELIKNSLTSDGVFSFNSCANNDFDESENTIFGYTIKQYRKFFKNTAVFTGKTSNLTYFDTVYGLGKEILDKINITNSILIASDKDFDENSFKNLEQEDLEKYNNLNIDIMPYINDIHKVYTH